MNYNYSTSEELVVVKLWESHLLYRSNDLYRTLTDLTIDRAAIPDVKNSGKILLRFDKSSWDDAAKGILYENRIPVVIQSNRLQAVRSAGRQPELRIPAIV